MQKVNAVSLFGYQPRLMRGLGQVVVGGVIKAE
jgi:hypothetical protein